MRTFLVYLAGPITGCTYGECVDWREDFTQSMPLQIQCLSPMRGKTSKGSTCHEPATEEEAAIIGRQDEILRRDKAIMMRDYFDCNRADVIVINLLGATRVSIGTMMELAWGYVKHTPMVVIIEKEGNIHDHPMLRECIKCRCETLEEAKFAVRAILDFSIGHEKE